jgi:hypothetical protein
MKLMLSCREGGVGTSGKKCCTIMAVRGRFREGLEITEAEWCTKTAFQRGKRAGKCSGNGGEKEQGGCNGFAGEEEFAYL